MNAQYANQGTMTMMSDDAFARLVAEDVKNRVTTDQKKYLRIPDNRPRWRHALSELLDELDHQISDLDDQLRNAEDRYGALGDKGEVLLAETQMSIDERKRKISRFRFHVESRLAEVDRMIAMGDSGGEQDAESFLRQAISTHRRLTIDEGWEATVVDHALWAALEGEWNFDDVELDFED